MAVVKDLNRGVIYKYTDAEIRPALYRPFFKQNLLWYKPLVEVQGRIPNLFPSQESDNIMICLCGVGVTKNFTCLIINSLPDYELIGKSQCFPLYWYEENKAPQGTLFDAADANRYVRRDGVSDWILKEVRTRFGGTHAITKEHIFYYVYGCSIRRNTGSVSPMT